MQHRDNSLLLTNNKFQSSSTDHSGCNPCTEKARASIAGFNPHPLITVDATGLERHVFYQSRSFNPHPLITVDATRK